MSNFPRSVIKSIQRGVVNATNGNTNTDVTITAVNTAKTALTWLGNDKNANSGVGYIKLLNSTTIRMTRSISNIDSSDISWEAVEYF